MFWFKKKIYPAFWQAYKACFSEKQQTNIDKIRFVIFDTETTGLHIKKDRILSIGTIAVIENMLKVNDQLECYVHQEIFNPETVKFHGLLKQNNVHKISEKEALIKFLSHIKNAVLVAHHAAFDVAMINQILKRNKLPKLKNKILDTGLLYKKTTLDTRKNHFSLDELSEKFNIAQHDRHTASGDAFITALLFVKIIGFLKKNNPKLTLNTLLKNDDSIGLL